MYPYLENPAFVSLGGGLPHSSTFPILQASFELPQPPNYDGRPFVHRPSANGHAHKADHHHHAHGHGAKEPAVPGKTIMTMYKGPQVGGAHAALDLAHAQQC